MAAPAAPAAESSDFAHLDEFIASLSPEEKEYVAQKCAAPEMDKAMPPEMVGDLDDVG
jgi:hypothetical protein